MKLIYGSVCSGIEAATVAWHPRGWTPAFFSEVEAFPRAVLSERYPEVPLHGDFTTIEAGDYGAIDLLCAGTPCQDFSVAGLRKGLDGDRGALTLQFISLAVRLRPRWVVWENVPGILSIDRGRAFGAFLNLMGHRGYGFAYRVLDAQHFGVPQRRRRVFVVGYLGDWRPAAAVLFEPESLRGDTAPRRETGQGIADCLMGGADTERNHGKRSGSDRDTLIAFSAKDHGADCGATAPTLRAGMHSSSHANAGVMSAIAFGGNNTAGPIDIATACNAHGGPHGWLDFESETFVTHSLRADGFDASEDGTGRGTPLVAFQSSQSGVRLGDQHPTLDSNNGSRRHHGALAGMFVRRLTPRECERLQGFPDDYTAITYRDKPAADGPRYRALGNSMAVPCMRWIGERITMVEGLL